MHAMQSARDVHNHAPRSLIESYTKEHDERRMNVQHIPWREKRVIFTHI